MAFEKPLLIQSFTAASDMTASTQQFTLVKFADSTGNVVPCTAVADLPIGVLQNLPRQGEQAEVCVLGITKIRVDATDITDVSATSGLLGVSASARATVLGAPGVGAQTTAYCIGRVINVDAADNDGGLTTAAINCINLGRHL
jgi:hypothetical protein